MLKWSPAAAARKRRKVGPALRLDDDDAGDAPEVGQPRLASVSAAAADDDASNADLRALCGEADDIDARSRELQEEGNSLAEAGKLGEALGKWEAAIRLTPEQPVLHEQKAQLLLEMGNSWGSIQAATRATELNPMWAEAWLTLARAQLNHGEPSLAVLSLQHSLQLDPKQNDVQAELAQARVIVARQQVLATRSASSGTLHKPIAPFRPTFLPPSTITSAAVEHSSMSTDDLNCTSAMKLVKMAVDGDVVQDAEGQHAKEDKLAEVLSED